MLNKSIIIVIIFISNKEVSIGLHIIIITIEKLRKRKSSKM